MAIDCAKGVISGVVIKDIILGIPLFLLWLSGAGDSWHKPPKG
jgi:hypothetical protein